jgi:hypothetical protein
MASGFGRLIRRHPVLLGGLLWGLSLVVVVSISDALRGYGFKPRELLVSIPIALLVGWMMA